jgi:mannose-6-phosphate isomerase-like protein (cupin superfamily)
LTRWVPGDDEVIIGMGTGDLENEAKSPHVDVSVSEGSIFLMPKDEPYRLRNVGKQDVEVRVIRIHLANPGCQ